MFDTTPRRHYWSRWQCWREEGYHTRCRQRRRLVVVELKATHEHVEAEMRRCGKMMMPVERVTGVSEQSITSQSPFRVAVEATPYCRLAVASNVGYVTPLPIELVGRQSQLNMSLLAEGHCWSVGCWVGWLNGRPRRQNKALREQRRSCRDKSRVTKAARCPVEAILVLGGSCASVRRHDGHVTRCRQYAECWPAARLLG